MALRTVAQLTADFPNDTAAHIQGSFAKVEQLVRDCFLTTLEAAQVLDWLGTAMDTFAEAFPAPAHLTASGGTGTSRQYAVVPRYPNPIPGGAGNVGGRYLAFRAGSRPEGRSTSIQLTAPTDDTPTSFYGKIGATAAVSSATVLSSVATVAMSTPPASAVTLTAFDCLVLDPGQPHFRAFALNQRPSVNVVDTGVRINYRLGYSSAGTVVGGLTTVEGAFADYEHSQVAVFSSTTSISPTMGTTVTAASEFYGSNVSV